MEFAQTLPDRESRLLSRMEHIVWEASNIMLSANHIADSVTSKEGHANFVTKYDKKVQKYLFSALSDLIPEAHFIGEEDGADAYTESAHSGFAFCVDPIDGTTNFVTGYRPSVTSVALLKSGAPYMGVVRDPYSHRMFSAAAGYGAALNGRPIRSSQAPLERSLVCFGTAPYYPELLEPTFELCKYYLPRCVDLRRSGAAAWDLCTVAMGVTGLFFEARLSLWDYAAAGLIATEAGCVLTDLEGKPLSFSGPSSILCASRGVAQEDYFPHVSVRPWI